MTGHDTNVLLQRYKELLPQWSELLSRLSAIVQALTSEGIRIHSISSRIKAWESVLQKLERLHEFRLDAISDLAGLKVLVLGPDDVKSTVVAVSKIFGPPQSFSSSTKQLHAAHLNLRFDRTAKLLHEFAGLTAEIQIITIEEDALRRIEHDLNYKRIEHDRKYQPHSPLEPELEQLERVVNEFESLLAKPDVHETRDIQSFLKGHQFLLYPNPEGIWSQVELGFGKEFVMDFLIREPTVTYILVELENPKHALFTANGDFTADVNHAHRQVEDWQDWIEANQALVESRYPDMRSPRAMIVIGRASSMDDVGKRRLARRNINLRGRVTIYTYDDLLQGARAYIASLRKHLGTHL